MLKASQMPANRLASQNALLSSFVLQSQHSAIGLSVAAKGIIRFTDKDRPEIKTEFL